MPTSPTRLHRVSLRPAKAALASQYLPRWARSLDQLKHCPGRCGVSGDVAVRAPALAAVTVDHGPQRSRHPVTHAAAETPARMSFVHHRWSLLMREGPMRVGMAPVKARVPSAYVWP